MPRPRSEQSELEPAVRLPAVPYFAEIARQLTMVQKLHARQLRTLGRRGYQLRPPARPTAHEEFVRPALPLIHRIVDHLDETVRPAVEMARQTLRDECRLPSASDSLISRVAERIHSLQWHIGFTIRSPPRWGDIKESDPRTS